jgi:4-hydroxybenzoate polyprenyltransferase
MMKLLDYIFFTRPALFPPVWTIVILGARAAAVGEGATPFASVGVSSIDWSFVLLLFLSTCLYAAVYTFNQIHDIESDKRNSKLFYLAEGMISIPSAYIFTLVLNAVAIAGGFYFSYRVGMLFVIILILGVFYSLPLTNFKGKPSHGYWSNAFGHGMVPFLIGWAFVEHVSLEAAIKSLPYLFGVGAIYLNTTLPDREGDKAVGKITHGVRWGVRTTTKATVFLVSLSIVLSQMAGDYAYLIAGVISLPFFVRALSTHDMKHVVMSTKVAILALSAFACVYFPPYILLLVIGFFGARAYYKSRFQIDYPSLG